MVNYFDRFFLNQQKQRYDVNHKIYIDKIKIYYTSKEIGLLNWILMRTP